MHEKNIVPHERTKFLRLLSVYPETAQKTGSQSTAGNRLNAAGVRAEAMTSLISARSRARVQCTTFLPGDAGCRTSALQPQGRCRLQHVIARREATWQSASPAAAHSGELRLRQIRKASRIRPNCCHLARFLCGENGLPRQCAHWLAMTC